MTVHAQRIELSAEYNVRIRSFYEQYFWVLEQEKFSEWPDFFSDRGYYTVQSAESRRGGFAICDIFCDSKGMIADRAAALANSSLFERRFIRYFSGRIRARQDESGLINVETTYLTIESVADEPPAIFSVGQTFDVLREAGSSLLLDRREVVYDHNAIRNSLIFPL